ncbi:MAG: peptidylprolyl isomerase [Cytophagales bacterium]|nr:peptidylprolyl isomerase [Cytophagales bacterium]
MSLRFSKMNKAFLVALMLCLGTFKGFAQEAVADRIIAKVGDLIILESELERTYAQMQQAGYAQAPTRCQVLEQLVVNKVMVVKAEMDSVIVTPEEVQAELGQRMQMIISQIGSEDKIEEYYGKTPEEFRKELEEPLYEQKVIQKMQQEITGNIKVTPQEIEKFFNDIPLAQRPYYSTEVQVGQIVRKPIVNEKEKSRVELFLLDLKKQVENGTEFGSLARKYSEDPGSAANGGELGYMKRGQLVPEFEAVAMKLKPGEIGEPTESDFGFHLIQLIDRRGNEFNARHILVKPNPTDDDFNKASHFLDSLRTLIKTDSITFEKMAKEHSEDKLTSGQGGYFLGSSGESQIPVDKLNSEVFFTIDTMKVGSITDPIKFRQQDGSEAMRILFFKSKKAPHEANMLDDYQKLMQMTMNSKVQAARLKWFQKAKKDVFIKIVPDYSCVNLNP